MIGKKMIYLSILLLACFPGSVNDYAQTHGTTALPSVTKALAEPVQPSVVTDFQLQEYLLARIPSLPSPANADQWRTEEQQMRRHVLEDVAFHGWPRQWIDSAPQFEQVGVIETGDGYRIRKFRYEIVPGFMSTALLYEPEKITGRVPAILNLIGHEPDGIAVEYEQKRCINFAKRGIVALDLGWMGFGELSQPENAHDYAADLNLVGSNALGLFYLAMRRGLDYLAASPVVDPTRLGVTGLSGGGWQTLILSAFDKRVAVAVEVAGFGSAQSNLTHPIDTDEIEEDAPDLTQNEDYPEFVAMRAPRPTLLIHNAEDDCCFRASLVKPYIYDEVKPFFQLFGVSDNLAWHENFDPGDHNYQLDNRQQAYRFFTEHFHMPVAGKETFSDDEIRTAQQLVIGVPANNLTIVSLAKQLANRIRRDTVPADTTQRASWVRSERKTLKSVIRYTPVSTLRALRMDHGIGLNFQTLSYRFDFSNGLSATGISFKENAAPHNQPVTIVLNDNGYKASGKSVFERLSRGEQVLALDLLFNGAAAPGPDPAAWVLLVDSTGDRSLGLEAAQLVATANWLRSTTGRSQIRVETNGIRSQVIALTAAAIDPSAFSDLVSQNAMRSLTYLIDKPVPFRSAPELFCLDLYKDFDLDSLTIMAAPTRIRRTGYKGRKRVSIEPSGPN
ncbi:MAG: prolyl oligopeptidase family serine peptidase [Acidobacteriaceae bacterium]